MRGRTIGRTAAMAALMAALAAAGTVRAAPACAPAGTERAMEAAVRGWFDAAHRDDLAAMAAIQAPGFYAYDNGKRYDGMTLGQLVKQAHAGGTQIDWNLHDFDIHAGCDQAWAAWINTGAVGTRGAMAPVTWLESATFAWTGSGWRLAFLHSGRVTPDAAAPPSQQNQGRRGRR